MHNNKNIKEIVEILNFNNQSRFKLTCITNGIFFKLLIVSNAISTEKMYSKVVVNRIE